MKHGFWAIAVIGLMVSGCGGASQEAKETAPPAQPEARQPAPTPETGAPRAEVPPPQAHPAMDVAPAVQELHRDLVTVTEKAAGAGDYTCCIAPACEFCGLHMGACPCGKNLAEGKGVCRECKGGWEVGEGRMAGINAAEVEGMSTASVMKMMKQKQPSQ